MAASARSTVSGRPSSLLKEPERRHRRARVGEHLGQHVLGAGLALRAGERHDRDVGQPGQRRGGRARPGRPPGRRPRHAGSRRCRARTARRPRRRRRAARRSRGRRRARRRSRRTGRPRSAIRLSRNAGPVDRRRPVVVDRLAADDAGDLGQRHGDHRATRPPARRAARRGRRTGARCPAISWPVSWPLPATTTVSPGAGQRHRQRDRRAPVADLVHLGALARRPPRAPASTAARIARRVLGARVVVGDHEHVGEPGRDLAHHRPLAGVAVAAGAETTSSRPGGQRAQRAAAPPRRRRACGRSRRRRGSPARRRPARAGRARRRRAAIAVGDRRGSKPASPQGAIAHSALATLKSPVSGTRRGDRLRRRGDAR